MGDPDPNHVVTSGFLFDLNIFLDFFHIWEKNIDGAEESKMRPNLGPWYGLKSDLFGAIVYSALQKRAQRIDLEIFKRGPWAVIEHRKTPTCINFLVVFPLS